MERACRIAQLHDFIAGLPDGYDTVVGEDGLLLSGGERRRLAIARAILKDAPIVILDEATADLDSTTEAALWSALDPWLAGKTVLVISHRPTVGAHVDRVVDWIHRFDARDTVMEAACRSKPAWSPPFSNGPCVLAFFVRDP